MKKQSSDLAREDEIFFCEGILSEILSWLEVKYVLRCKSVCKLWHAIIKNKQFVGMHATHDGRRSFYYISGKGESVPTKSINSEGIIENIRYLSISGTGFVLVERSSLATSQLPSPKYQLSNPSTKSILNLPDPHSKVLFMDIFLNSSTNSYNVISLFFDEKNVKHTFKLFDLGGQSKDPCPNANLSWRTLDISEFDNQIFNFSCAMYKGVLYILNLPQVGSGNLKIICFDLVKQQNCRTLKAPDQSLRFNWREVRFTTWRGKPGVSFVLEDKLNIWVLEDYKKQKWADTIQIPLPFLKKYPDLKQVPHIYCDDDGQPLLVYSTGPEWTVYNPKLEEGYKIPCPAVKIPATLVSVRGMQNSTQN